MADKDDGAGAYGTRHLMEEQMRADRVGVFEGKSRKAAPENKDRGGAPSDKALSRMTRGELLDEAKRRGVAVESDDNKADLVGKLRAAIDGTR